MRMLLGLGANLGDPRATLDHALAALEHVPGTRVLRHSSVYRTVPVGYADQPTFFNLVAEIDTTLSPAAMLGACLGIEAGLGRVRSFANAPRVIDIDLLLADGAESHTAELTLPHPRMRERAFVLIPLAELYPSGEIYGYSFSTDINRADRRNILGKSNG